MERFGDVQVEFNHIHLWKDTIPKERKTRLKFTRKRHDYLEVMK